MEDNLRKSGDNTPQIKPRRVVSHVAVPHLRHSSVGDEQEKTSTNKEAQRRALNLNRTLRDALAALALVVVAEDLLSLLLSQLLHVEQDCRNLVWLAPGTAQLKEGYRDTA